MYGYAAAAVGGIGDFAGSIQLQAAAIEMLNNFPFAGPLTLSTLRLSLGTEYARVGRYNEAEDILYQVRYTYTCHGTVLNEQIRGLATRELASIAAGRKDFQAALYLYRDAHRWITAVVGETHTHSLHCLRQVNDMLCAQGDSKGIRLLRAQFPDSFQILDAEDEADQKEKDRLISL